MKWYILIGIIIVGAIIGTAIFNAIKPGEFPGTLPDKFTMPQFAGIAGLGTSSYYKKNGKYYTHFSGSSFGIISTPPSTKEITKNEYKQAYQNYLYAKEQIKTGVLPG